jgi:hypothetical protein
MELRIARDPDRSQRVFDVPNRELLIYARPRHLNAECKCTKFRESMPHALRTQNLFEDRCSKAHGLTASENGRTPWQNRDKTFRVEPSWVAFERKADSPSC